ncbi:hypothetical protein PPIS_b0004 [Pseudoalteromonas piscicida]|uniref:Uncharacterized protein n=1 Tax=Pseudoalteromonas piscicida TaxID=43662 RepID=A0ABN5CQK4_PSEO7|nr:hypothetical protein PPIS_b0004 [Pseudoalteromonas piscicida]
MVILCKSGDKDFVLLQSHLTPHPCGATLRKCQSSAALWVHLSALCSLLLNFCLDY